jgi:hypothetical protein
MQYIAVTWLTRIKVRIDLLPDMEDDYIAWENEKKSANGLFWQYDVRDAMEETISGGRREKNPRPSINSYMFGNAMALQKLNLMTGNGEKHLCTSQNQIL